MFKPIQVILGATIFATLVGCATKQQNVELSENFWQNKNQKVTVATTKAPQPQIYQTGDAGGLLGLAITAAMNNKLENHIEKLDLAWYQDQLPRKFAERLKQRHVNTQLSSTQLNSQDKNMAIQVGADKLLVLKLDAVGVKRRYNGVVPAEDPKAYCVITGELRDTANQVLWHYQASASEQVEGAWDQPPNYPNLTKAIEVAIHSAEQELMDSFFAG